MVSVELFGYLAMLTINISLIPQVLKSWRTRSTKDISLAWTCIYVVGLFFWIIYGFGLNSKPLIFSASFELLLAASLLVLKVKYR